MSDQVISQFYRIHLALNLLSKQIYLTSFYRIQV